MASTINLIIADDHTLFIEGLTQLIKDETDMHVIDSAKMGKSYYLFYQSRRQILF